MKMGQIRVSLELGGFEMMTPDGIQPVTLRCTNAGVVEVEEVAEGHMSTAALTFKIEQNYVEMHADGLNALHLSHDEQVMRARDIVGY